MNITDVRHRYTSLATF